MVVFFLKNLSHLDLGTLSGYWQVSCVLVLSLCVQSCDSWSNPARTNKSQLAFAPFQVNNILVVTTPFGSYFHWDVKKIVCPTCGLVFEKFLSVWSLSGMLKLCFQNSPKEKLEHSSKKKNKKNINTFNKYGVKSFWWEPWCLPLGLSASTAAWPSIRSCYLIQK